MQPVGSRFQHTSKLLSKAPQVSFGYGRGNDNVAGVARVERPETVHTGVSDSPGSIDVIIVDGPDLQGNTTSGARRRQAMFRRRLCLQATLARRRHGMHGCY
eukprot:scaffold447452_cov23-Prasinocladus_malaysianus.AAC.2